MDRYEEAARNLVDKLFPPVIEPVRIHVSFEKADVDLKLGVIYGVASTVRKDHTREYADIDTLEKAAVNFMEAQVRKAGEPTANDTHFEDIPGVWVASWVDRDQGVWRVGFKPDDRSVAKAAYNGEFVGFSIEGQADRVFEAGEYRPVTLF